MKCFSVRAPWFVYLLYGAKEIENRDGPIRYRGPVLIHTSRFSVGKEILDDLEIASRLQRFDGPMRQRVLWRDVKWHLGCVVGQAEIVDCVTESESPWFCGPYRFVLQNRVAFEKPFPVRGQPGFFEVPNSLVEQARETA